MKFDPVNRPTQGLLAVLLVLGLVVALQLVYPAAPKTVADAAGESGEQSLPEFGGVALSPPSLVELTDMMERPLFMETRRMPEPEEAAPPPPPTPLRLKLLGVAISGGSRVALLRNTSNNFLVQLAEGESHDGWTLDAVDAKSAHFSRGEQKTELPLEVETGSRRRR